MEIYDLIIIGGGPAGITAGIYASRKKIKTALLTKDFFGQITKNAEIDNYPGIPHLSGLELMKRLEQHLKSFDLDIKEGINVVKVQKAGDIFEVALAKGEKFGAKSLIVASGGEPRQLGIEGEKEFLGHGVSYCSICDAPFYHGKVTAVVGGGNSGFESAIDLSRYAQKVYLLESGEQVRADELLREQASYTGKIEVRLNKSVLKITGDKFVAAIDCIDVKTGQAERLDVSGVFILAGSTPVTAFLAGLVDTNANGEIKIDASSGQTSLAGLFAAGDVADGKWKQFIVAAGQGANAALAAYDFLNQIKKHN